MKAYASLSSAFALLLLTCATATAQQVSGVPGSPGAETTVDGRYLPAPPQKFEGDIGVNAVGCPVARPTCC
jgi:arylsulfatase